MTLRLCRVFIDLWRPVRPDHLMFLIDYMNIYWTFWILLLRDFVTKFQENFKKYFLRMFFFFFFWENFSFVRLNFVYRWPIFEVWSKLFSQLFSQEKKRFFFLISRKKKDQENCFVRIFVLLGEFFHVWNTQIQYFSTAGFFFFFFRRIFSFSLEIFSGFFILLGFFCFLLVISFISLI